MPSDPPKLLLDEMLRRVGHWLRAAGHDVAIAAPGTDDGAIVRQAKAEGRLLVTCDRRMAERRLARGRVLIYPVAPPDETAVALGRALGIDWLYQPFTRCLMDNAVLREADEEERKRVPKDAMVTGGPVNLCPDCGRLYWPGSHVVRLRKRLEDLRAASAAPQPRRLTDPA